MFNFFKRRTIENDAKDFEEQYKIAKMIVFEYLEVRFEYSFSSPGWKELFADKPTMHTVMAAEVMRYLLCLDELRTHDELEKREEVVMAKQHAEKWADDLMNTDKEFCEFIIMTLRMDAVFNAYYNGTDWSMKDSRGKKVFQIMLKHGNKVSTPPDPKEYKKLLKRWMRWDANVARENLAKYSK